MKFVQAVKFNTATIKKQRKSEDKEEAYWLAINHTKPIS